MGDLMSAAYTLESFDAAADRVNAARIVDPLLGLVRAEALACGAAGTPILTFWADSSPGIGSLRFTPVDGAWHFDLYGVDDATADAIDAAVRG